jgi:hypothetical protein
MSTSPVIVVVDVHFAAVSSLPAIAVSPVTVAVLVGSLEIAVSILIVVAIEDPLVINVSVLTAAADWWDFLGSDVSVENSGVALVAVLLVIDVFVELLVGASVIALLVTGASTTPSVAVVVTVPLLIDVLSIAVFAVAVDLFEAVFPNAPGVAVGARLLVAHVWARTVFAVGIDCLAIVVWA